jgi:hypothetical protein
VQCGFNQGEGMQWQACLQMDMMAGMTLPGVSLVAMV